MMDGVLVFSKHDDLIFIHANETFRTHIHTKAKENGLVDPKSPKPRDLDPNIVLQLYSPILMSQRAMIGKLHNAYHSITCKNGTSMVFAQHQTDIYLAVTDSSETSVELVKRKLLIIQSFLSFLFGPVHNEIKSDRVSERTLRWSLLSKLTEMWQELQKTEQSYLVEAMERLHVNQMLNSKCIELLEAALAGLKAAGEKHSLHAMLFVDCKLLSLYSNRNAYELQTSDTLLINVLLKASFPTDHKLEDLFARSYSTYSGKTSLTTSMPVYIRSVDGERYESASEGPESDVEYFSTPSTPKESSKEEGVGVSPKSYVSPQGPLRKNSSVGDSFFTPMSTPFRPDASVGQQSNESSVEKRVSVRTDSPTGQSVGSVHSAISSDSPHDRYQCHHVFLSTPACKVTPHTLHLVEILPGISLAVVCEVPKAKQASILYTTIHILWAILSGSHRQLGTAKAIVETVDSHVKKMLDFAKKVKGSTSIEKLTKGVQKHWVQAKEAGLISELDSRETNELSHRIEDSLSTMYDLLRRLFRALYIQPRKPPSEDLLAAIDQVRQRLRKHLQDYEAYLAVKAQRNIAITSYVEDFPGLVHFMFVDRITNQLTAPSINISADDVDQVAAYVKQQIWKIYPMMQSKLQAGYLTASVRHGDFLFSYFLWFEDSAGNAISAHQVYNGSISTLPGILAGPFYRQLLKHCFPSIGSQRSLHCYELLTVHVGIVPSQYALQHARKLVHRMWEASAETDSPISLL